jgi:hypothetical protein
MKFGLLCGFQRFKRDRVDEFFDSAIKYSESISLRNNTFPQMFREEMFFLADGAFSVLIDLNNEGRFS